MCQKVCERDYTNQSVCFFHASWGITVMGSALNEPREQKVTKKKENHRQVQLEHLHFALVWVQTAFPRQHHSPPLSNFVPEARWGVAKHLKQVYCCPWTSFRPFRFACQNWNPRPAWADRQSCWRFSLCLVFTVAPPQIWTEHGHQSFWEQDFHRVCCVNVSYLLCMG